jgi:hypothetical protein
VASWLGTGNPLTFFYSVIFLNVCCFSNVYLEHEDVRPRPALTHGSPNRCIYSENIKIINYWNKAHLQQTYGHAASTGTMYFVFCRLYPLFPSHLGSIGILPVISLLLTNTVSPVRACLIMVLWYPKRRQPSDTVDKKSGRSVAHNFA